MSFDYDDPGDLHEDCVSVDEVVNYVFENNWDEVEKAVSENDAKEWFSETRVCLELLNVLSQRDQARMSGVLKKHLRTKSNCEDNLSDEQLFSIAADVAAYLEQLNVSVPPPPFAHTFGGKGYQRELTAAQYIQLSGNTCTLSDDLSWAKHLLTISRAFRDFLAAVCDTDLREPYLHLRLTGPIQVFNTYLLKSPAQLLVYWQDVNKQLRFGRTPEPEFSDLPSYIANWISEYLKNHFSHLSLGVCAECGKFFARERRDKVFCSKTCQNRVAYKRKKILESNALVQVNVQPDEACEIAVGLLMHHPRHGIGLVEAVSSDSSWVPSLGTNVLINSENIIRYRLMLSRKILVQVRFLHGMRTLGYTDLFEAQKTEDQLPTFYEVKSEETLAELL